MWVFQDIGQIRTNGTQRAQHDDAHDRSTIGIRHKAVLCRESMGARAGPDDAMAAVEPFRVC
jgi:hypothetical protein